ncbi:MFS transporter [Pseudonocardia endophytica]|uniref:EmrB/QacA subfamily drug resistance transporter n=1 Tax=Pseudonocardia endophytica TaxID=401976 RepID=A0A4R1HJJ7_PSEEN|nr:MFS transporter [Pseudonocardia endophytica]TCK22497.1 EmrB/QacA subfamily drug resistance transporter [Pseudonocardia endophytica]
MTGARRPALLVAGCFFMEYLDVTIVTTSAAPLAASLGTTAEAVGLVISAYLVAMAVALPVGGWLAERFGYRRVLLAAIAVFTLASLGCGLSTAFGELVAFRVAQGVGGALMVPVGRLMLVDGVAKRDVPRLMASVFWPGLVAPVIAPLLGALLTTYAGWRWMFLINVPLGAVGLVLAVRWIRTSAGRPVAPLDRTGLVLTAVGLCGVVWASHLVVDGGATTAGVTGVVGLAVLGCAVLHLRRTAHPLVDLSVLRVRSFRATAAGGALFWMVVSAVPFLLPLQFQEVFGWSAVTAGAVVLAVFAGNVGVRPVSTALIDRFGLRTLLVVSGVVLALTLVACAVWTSAVPLAAVVAVCVVSGAARSVGLTAYTTMAFAELTGAALRHANTLNAVVQQTAMGLGVAVAATALQGGFRMAFGLLTALTLLAVVDAWRLDRGAGDAVRA